MAPVSSTGSLSASATMRATVLFPAPAGPSITTTRFEDEAAIVADMAAPYIRTEATLIRGPAALAHIASLVHCRSMRRSSRPSLACLALVLSVAGCAITPPSQRGLLAQPEMDPALDVEEETFHSHIEAAREGGFGGHGAQGGGCGCG